MYFEIQGTYFKINALYFQTSALCSSSVLKPLKNQRIPGLFLWKKCSFLLVVRIAFSHTVGFMNVRLFRATAIKILLW